MKFKVLLIAVFSTLLLSVLATAAQAQGEPPSPYAGLKNPFSWDDTSTQEKGKELYQQSCLGCHGINGGNMAGADFSAIDYPQSLEERPDFYFWVLSEGSRDRGMPSFKSFFSEEQRWQVLTYLWSLGGKVPSEATPPPTQPPTEGVEGTLLLTVPKQAQSGQPLTISAVLRDKEANSIVNVPVKFFINVDFFTIGLMEIGEVVTNGQGTAVLEYTPRQSGDIEVVARYGAIETATILTLAEGDEHFYHPEVDLPTFGVGVHFGGSESPFEPGEEGAAPGLSLRIPGGLTAWILTAYVLTVILVWSLYSRVMYQVFRIPIVSEIRDTNTRLVPLIGMAMMGVFVSLLVLMLITGPYTHLHTGVEGIFLHWHLPW